MTTFRRLCIPALLTIASLSTGCGTPSLLITPVSQSTELNEEIVEHGHGFFADKIAIIDVEGMLINARSGGFLQPSENKLSLFNQELDKATNDPKVKAVVLRVNSPGGTVSTSDAMYELVQRFKKKTGKPVVASSQEITASGAYYVSCAADKIVVQPTSVVGSIGVIFENFDVADGLAKIGVKSDAVKSGPLKEMGSPFKHTTPLEREVMQSMVDEYFDRFKFIVSSNRPVKEALPPVPLPQDYAGVYSGRVFSGAKAVELGLADQTGLLSDAIDLARSLSKSPNAAAVLYKRPYGYGGSIYAASNDPRPQASVINLNLPGSDRLVPTGFYYLWEP